MKDWLNKQWTTTRETLGDVKIHPNAAIVIGRQREGKVESS